MHDERNHHRQVLALLVNRADRLSSEETRPPCDNLRFVDRTLQESHDTSFPREVSVWSVVSCGTASRVIEEISGVLRASLASKTFPFSMLGSLSRNR